MLAVQLVKITIILRVVLRAVPPIPITAFGNQQLFKGQAFLLRRCLARILSEEITRGGEAVPGSIVLRRANPYIKVGVDPGPWKNCIEPLGRTLPLNGF